MSSNFIYSKILGEDSNQALNSIKRETSIKVFRNEVTGKISKFTNVQMQRYKRNKTLSLFFETYQDTKKYSLIEYGVPYLVTEKIERITQKIKRRCLNNGFKVLGYYWQHDVGAENFGAHYHLVVAIERYFGKRYPDFLKIEFMNRSIHGNFVRHREAFRRYLLVKDVFERGKRKRVFSTTKRFKEC